MRRAVPTADELKRIMSYLGSIKSDKKAKTSAENGRLGGAHTGKNRRRKKTVAAK